MSGFPSVDDVLQLMKMGLIDPREGLDLLNAVDDEPPPRGIASWMPKLPPNRLLLVNPERMCPEIEELARALGRKLIVDSYQPRDSLALFGDITEAEHRMCDAIQAKEHVPYWVHGGEP